MQDYSQHYDLVRKCTSGDRRAQLELYRAYSKAMYNICYRMMGHTEEAEDVLQNAFIDIFSHLARFRFESSVGAWIKRIVINHCITALKKRKVQWEEFSDEKVDMPTVEYNPSMGVEEVEHIKKAISQLPDGYRSVFTLYCLEGYDHKEISQILSISEGASKSQYSRAKRRLHEILVKKTNVS